MKKGFDQKDVFHDKLITGFVHCSVTFFPLLCAVLAGWSADHFFFNRFQAIIRWPAVVICAAFGCYVLGLFMVLITGGIFENTLDGWRKLIGREPIGITVRQHEKEKIAGMEKIEQEFIEMDTNDKLLELFRSQYSQLTIQAENFTYFEKKIKRLKYTIIALFVFAFVIWLFQL